MSEQEFYTLDGAAKQLRRTRRHVARLIAAGSLQAEHLPPEERREGYPHWRVSRQAIEECRQTLRPFTNSSKRQRAPRR